MNVSLASNLLKLELDAERVASEAGGTVWKTGIDVLDRGLPDGLWSGGRVIGVGVGAGVGIVESGRMLKVSLLLRSVPVFWIFVAALMPGFGVRWIFMQN